VKGPDVAESVLSRITKLLTDAGVPFVRKDHAPTRTSEESAAVRGEDLGVGAKALVLRADGRYGLFVLPADQKLDGAAVKRELRTKQLRFATPDELMALTGLVPGSVPPFGEPVLPLPLYADSSVGTRHTRLAFNAGSLTVSIVMAAVHWEAVARPQRFRFSKSETA
jgi:prolyl-tRNA editing enzyme YbaK/EbsC (Cys-tRNA(Pro) deacylase)